ncbi:unnamed protein product [Oppiella nova]|uniref:serine C-palmitoyltransferase n=1 Tax=Oppiella nova TaxID=334625 RepID=A0A7R9LU12_9ACAR|nr:unnamed protein product [Oppiella nova]CAG2166996.1 unnamed protein product [Oppiella nova]
MYDNSRPKAPFHMNFIENDTKSEESYTQRLYTKFYGFYYRNIIWRFMDRLAHPICSVAGETISIMERHFSKFNRSFKLTGRVYNAINFGSYNYLGYAQTTGHITDSVDNTIKQLGVGVCSTATELGRQQIYCDLETLVAKYLDTEDAIVYGMGFATNAYTMSALFGKGCLVLSDEHNHSSIALGCKTSGAHIQVFKHNDMTHLERIVRHSIVSGQPRTGRAWRKIVVIMEGIYSMEGTIVNLPEVLRIKKQYKLYLYLDEAHSIGAIGARGRGVCDYYGCDPRDVDILMGTFTKSFAAAGGYLAGNAHTIAYLRCQTAAFHYACPMAPPVAQQIISVLTELYYNQNDSHTRLKSLHENTVYFRQKLKQLGYHLDGNDDSPVVPLMVLSNTSTGVRNSDNRSCLSGHFTTGCKNKTVCQCLTYQSYD